MHVPDGSTWRNEQQPGGFTSVNPQSHKVAHFVQHMSALVQHMQQGRPHPQVGHFRIMNIGGFPDNISGDRMNMFSSLFIVGKLLCRLGKFFVWG